MTGTRTQASVAALVVYAALGVALGMVVWALVLHNSSGSDGGGEAGKPFQIDRQQTDERRTPLRRDDG